MENQIVQLLNDQVAKFKNTAWNDAVEDLGFLLGLTNMRITCSSAPYRVSMEVLKDNEPLFTLTLFFRIYPGSLEHPSWQTRLGITLTKGNMATSGLEKRFPRLDAEVNEITGADITDMVKSLIHKHGKE